MFLPFLKTLSQKSADMAQIRIFQRSPPYLIAEHLVIPVDFAPISSEIWMQQPPCE